MVDVFDANGSGKMTGGVLLAFGNFSTDLPKCATVTYNKADLPGKYDNLRWLRDIGSPGADKWHDRSQVPQRRELHVQVSLFYTLSL